MRVKRWFFFIIIQLVLLLFLSSAFVIHIAEIIDINNVIDIEKVEKIIDDTLRVKIIVEED